MARSTARTDTVMRTANRVHRLLLAVSGGRLGSRIVGMPVHRLTTTGRVSGQKRTVLITVPVRHGAGYVLVASRGGDDRHPDWYRNLVADPVVSLEPVDGGPTVPLVARTASPGEKAELWPRIVAVNPGYDRYQSRTGRDIPVVIAEPADD